jgi:hypothetical protein
MILRCARCDAPIPGQDIDLVTGLARCRPCGADQLLPSAREIVASLPVPRAALMPLGRPKKLRMRERKGADGSVQASLRGSPVKTASEALGIWSGLYMSFLVTAIDSAPLLGMLIVPLAAVAAVLASRVRVRLDALELSCRDRFPLRATRVATDQILDFLPAEQSVGWIRHLVPKWCVHARTRDGRLVELRLELANRHHAEWVAAWLNRALADVRTRLLSERALTNDE